jgi:hypothetical protein
MLLIRDGQYNLSGQVITGKISQIRAAYILVSDHGQFPIGRWPDGAKMDGLVTVAMPITRGT